MSLELATFNEGITHSFRGRTAIVEPATSKLNLTDDELDKYSRSLVDGLQYLNRLNLRYDVSGIISAGKTTFSGLLKKHMRAVEIKEETKTPFLDLLYHDILTYIFSFQFVASESRWEHLDETEKLRINESIINDRAPIDDLIFTGMFKEDGIMTHPEYEAARRKIIERIHDKGHPDVLIWLQVSPQAAFERSKKRGRAYEIDKGLRELNQEEIEVLGGARDYLAYIVKRDAPLRFEDYMKKHVKAGTPTALKGGGVTLGYLTKLHEYYNKHFEEILDEVGFRRTLLKINWDERDPEEYADPRNDPREVLEVIRHVNYATMLSLSIGGWSLDMDYKAGRYSYIKPSEHPKLISSRKALEDKVSLELPLVTPKRDEKDDSQLGLPIK